MKRRSFLQGAAALGTGALLGSRPQGAPSAAASAGIPRFSVKEPLPECRFQSELIDRTTPNRPGYLLTASDEFAGGHNQKLWVDHYLPHWSTPDRTKARYAHGPSALRLQIEKDMPGWDAVKDPYTKVSSFQSYERDHLHRWADYSGVHHHETPQRNYLQKYGYFELRAKVAPGGGLHSAWWMIGANQDKADGDGSTSGQAAEIDIFEFFGRNRASRGQIAFHAWHDRRLLMWGLPKKIGAPGVDYSQDYHVFGMEWEENHLLFTLDGAVTCRQRRAPDYPLLTLLGVYEKTRPTSWSGPFDPTVPYPKTFEIDYFRAYQRVPAFPWRTWWSDGYLAGTARARNHVTRHLGGGVGNHVSLRHLWVPRAGFHEVGVEYRCAEARPLYLQVNGRDVVDLGRLGSGSFRGSFSVAKRRLPLQAGFNTLTAFSPREPAPDLGRVLLG
ncbi:Glycosyl hydrolases family 16 [Austwickia chelonae]|uniref:GH16 domain-containing protein n=1 Tax=Austwickia chelonae NBRC 105200 TaxID=1184607 RepID=K6W801_9MICO|nr:family 16 glycosylhydrolase [Austwickia chelonae]GAB77967.1 hypothetical protein AUCHE_08_02100 [Austwickia chelonae NBRC 105200]SEV93272.1 Glycosyl hydrolases family 16 [Austwickia chelonae]